MFRARVVSIARARRVCFVAAKSTAGAPLTRLFPGTDRAPGSRAWTPRLTSTPHLDPQQLVRCARQDPLRGPHRQVPPRGPGTTHTRCASRRRPPSFRHLSKTHESFPRLSTRRARKRERRGLTFFLFASRLSEEDVSLTFPPEPGPHTLFPRLRSPSCSFTSSLTRPTTR